MPAAPHYPHAPIEEAILEVGVTPAAGTGVETLVPLKDELVGDYPTAGPAGENLFEFEGGPRPSAAAHACRTGFLLRDRLGRRLVGLRYDRFSFHRLRPYETWEEFRGEARRLWNRFRETAGPSAVTDVGLRYVNRFDLPAGGRLSEFLTIYPQVPDWAKATAQGAGANGEVFLQVRLPRPDVGRHAGRHVGDRGAVARGGVVRHPRPRPVPRPRSGDPAGRDGPVGPTRAVPRCQE